MAKKYIKNDVVKMDWDAATFYESRKNGFMAAVHVYETRNGVVPVMFKDWHAFLLIDTENGKPATSDELAAALKDCFDNDMNIEEAYEECYVELDDEGTAAYYGLTSEDLVDIEQRLKDLSGYWYTIEEDF